MVGLVMKEGTIRERDPGTSKADLGMVLLIGSQQPFGLPSPLGPGLTSSTLERPTRRQRAR